MRKRIINNPSADPQHSQHMQQMQHPQHREDPLASPELRQNPFSAPAGYMDSFEERIMQRIGNLAPQESLAQQQGSGQQEHFGQQHVSSQQCVSGQQHVSSQQHGLGLRALLKPAIGFAASFALLFSLGYGIISLTKFLEKTPQKIALQMRDTTISSPIENNVANQTNEEATESIDAAEEYLIYYGATIATLTADATE